MNFGIKTHGKHSIIKINCRINSESRNEIEKNFKDLIIYTINKGLTRIEGCIKYEQTDYFLKILKSSTLKYKIEVMNKELDAILYQYEEDDLSL